APFWALYVLWPSVCHPRALSQRLGHFAVGQFIYQRFGRLAADLYRDFSKQFFILVYQVIDNFGAITTHGNFFLGPVYFEVMDVLGLLYGHRTDNGLLL